MAAADVPMPALRRPLTPWLFVLAGLAAMYLPVYVWAFQTIWQTEEHGHGAIVLAILAWLFWSKREALAAAPSYPALVPGILVFGFGLLVFFVGQVLGISVLQFGSQIPVLFGLFLMLRGWPSIRIVWFPLLYLIFMIPLPGILVDAVTGQLKQWVSVIAEELLYFAGYPIARNGVMLTVGQYQMLVADACSGLNSMFSLAALGTVFMYMMDRKSRLHNAIMLAAILPIAFSANIIRVIILVLVTYHLGDEAGQGFLHGTAGIVLMLVALTLFFGLDASMAWFARRFGARRARGSDA